MVSYNKGGTQSSVYLKTGSLGENLGSKEWSGEDFTMKNFIVYVED